MAIVVIEFQRKICIIDDCDFNWNLIDFVCDCFICDDSIVRVKLQC